ncbi:MAG: chloride channel protein [Halobacteriota archaeon]
MGSDWKRLRSRCRAARRLVRLPLEDRVHEHNVGLWRNRRDRHPIFFIGSTAGSLFAQVFGLNSATFAAIGLVAVLAGATNTPIAASIISVELFGPAVAPYAAVACVVSYVMSGHRSSYPTQVLAAEKSRSIQVQIGKEVTECEPTVQPRAGSVTGADLVVITRIRDFIAKHFRLRQRPR